MNHLLSLNSFSFRYKVINNKSIYDIQTSLTWQRSGSTLAMTYEDAEVYVACLNDSHFGGWCDWRLPTLEEAESLMTIRKHNDVYICPFFSPTKHLIWTSDKEKSDTVWVVLYSLGFCKHMNEHTLSYTRAVRKGE